MSLCENTFGLLRGCATLPAEIASPEARNDVELQPPNLRLSDLRPWTPPFRIFRMNTRVATNIFFFASYVTLREYLLGCFGDVRLSRQRLLRHRLAMTCSYDLPTFDFQTFDSPTFRPSTSPTSAFPNYAPKLAFMYSVSGIGSSIVTLVPLPSSDSIKKRPPKSLVL